ncbi:dTDP-6-deoxy-L-talose 4-dehydrogenase (NAD+) [Rhizobium sp. RU20A]|uniref:NAD-dependent epimerase/dehydratase family protein n=1 Tax=Rhizobium sp. RU20A TaxID=1907412 RepID=UPI000955201B|nr:NAD(P)-dependent oxidoreductase [Rhizobium sp. RU20A]SIQ59938.1 dTDP-6-deoxy-L-talose 4-dehydrogenase (NAD+) [Rhizobium sp. RU20A]
MTHVLVTGATGFVGRQVVKALLANDHTVTAICRPGSEGKLGTLADKVAIIVSADMFRESEEWLAGHLTGKDAVIHVAWYVEPGKYLDSPENLACVEGSLRLARAAVAAGVGHVIGVGTCFEYRLPSDHLTVESPLAPQTLYAASKLSVYHMLGQYLAKQDTRFSWCRLFYLFGEGEHPARLVPYVRGRLAAGETAKLSAGTQIRDFLDVAIAGAMIADVVRTGQPGAINICSGRPTTIRALVEGIADEVGRRDLLEFGTAAIHPSDPAAVVGVCNAIAPERVRETSDESPAEAAHQSGRPHGA